MNTYLPNEMNKQYNKNCKIIKISISYYLCGCLWFNTGITDRQIMGLIYNEENDR